MPNDDMIQTDSVKIMQAVIKRQSKEFAKIWEKTKDPIKLKLLYWGNTIRNTAIESMQDTPKTGNWYRRGKKWHIASSPGNPPAIDRGTLISKIVPRVNDNGNDLELEVGALTGAPHGYWMEKGTKWSLTEHIVAPRPWLEPAVQKNLPEMMEDVGKVTYEIIRGIVDSSRYGE